MRMIIMATQAATMDKAIMRGIILPGMPTTPKRRPHVLQLRAHEVNRRGQNRQMRAVDRTLTEQGDGNTHAAPHTHPGCQQHRSRFPRKSEHRHHGTAGNADQFQKPRNLQGLNDDEGHQHVGEHTADGNAPTLTGAAHEDVGHHFFCRSVGIGSRSFHFTHFVFLSKSLAITD